MGNLKTSFYGDGITRSEYVYNVPIEEKLESVFQIRDVLSKDVVLDVVTNLKLLVITAQDDIVITFEKTDLETFELNISANYPFIFPVAEGFIDTIEKITISTDSLNLTDVSVRAYGSVTGV
jgi:hypothetical protein